MKRTITLLALAALAVSGIWAQSATVTLQNQEDATFFYVLDPSALNGMSAGSPLIATKAAAFFAAAKTDVPFAALAPNAEASLTQLTDGTHLLVGVFALDGETDLPVRIISLDADSSAGSRSYAVFATPSDLTVSRGTGRIAALIPAAAAAAATAGTATADPGATATTTSPGGTTTATTTATTIATTTTTTAGATTTSTTSTTTTSDTTSTAAAPADTAANGGGTAATVATANTANSTAATTTSTTAAPDAVSAQAARPAPKLGQIASFASYDPVTFSKERQGAFTVLPIADSRGWKLTGTRIAGLSGVMDAAGLHLALTVPNGFSENVSYFFYVFSDRSTGTTNALTLELLPRAEGSRGACLLWKKGASVPHLIGSVRTTRTSVAVDLDTAEIASALGDASVDSLTVDLTSGWYDRALGTWEEFYYTTISATQIPSTR